MINILYVLLTIIAAAFVIYILFNVCLLIFAFYTLHSEYKKLDDEDKEYFRAHWLDMLSSCRRK
jgi:hypothetical protein